LLVKKIRMFWGMTVRASENQFSSFHMHIVLFFVLFFNCLYEWYLNSKLRYFCLMKVQETMTLSIYNGGFPAISYPECLLTLRLAREFLFLKVRRFKIKWLT
jgi:hypothetical protein